jgi:RND family efflux transporter MFP subunit
LAILAIFAGLACLFGCGRDSSLAISAQAQAAQAAVAVQTTKPAIKDVARVITLPADAAAWQEATLYAKVAGTLERILVDKGDRVKAGQLVATIRAPELEADREQAQNTYLAAEAATRVSEATGRKSRDEELRANAAAEKARTDYQQAPASVERAKAQAQQANSGAKRAQDLRLAALSALDESRTQVAKAEADLEAARAEQHLAQVTFGRYEGIYNKDSRLIARQQVDEAQARLGSAQGKVGALQSQIQAAKARVKSAESQVSVADHQLEEATAGVAAARDQVAIAEGQRASLGKQVDVATREIAISRSQGEVSTAQARQYAFQARAQQSAEGRQAILADYAKIHAPFAGVVTKRQADAGAFIQTASASQNAAAIATIADVDRIRVYLHVPETESGFARPGTPVELSGGTLGREKLQATVTRTSRSLDPKSRTLLAEVDIPNRGGLLLPGSYLSARVELETHRGAISLPSAAIGSEKAGKFVFIVEGGKAKRVPVTIGFDNGRIAEVTEGLKGGEEVVVTGRDALTPGTPVTTSKWTPKKETKP